MSLLLEQGKLIYFLILCLLINSGEIACLHLVFWYVIEGPTSFRSSLKLFTLIR
jgi:hypothetical protein